MIVFDNVFIPAHRVMDATPARSGEAPGGRIHNSPIYTSAFTPMLCVSALSAIVGGTLGAAAYAVERSKTFLSSFSGKTSVDNPALQIRLAKADLAAETASRMIDQLAEEIEADSLTAPIPIERRARQRAMSSYITSLCRDTVTSLAQGTGASGHMLDSPLQRSFRDITMASCHVVFDQDPTMEMHGKMLVGRRPPVILA
ncbi:MAG: acyl-CoA dehydrogenase family protein [Hyphomonas sp.]